jgi:hypothetical protein
MKTPKDQKQVVVSKDEQISKELKNSGCCDPTCCNGANKKETKRKAK